MAKAAPQKDQAGSEKEPVVKKKHWKKPKDKPPRNLSAYNYFFKLMRQQIMEEAAVAAATAAAENSINGTGEEAKPTKIGFGGLARSIAEQWKHIDTANPALKALCEEMAELDKDRYRLELEDWKAKRLAAILNSNDTSTAHDLGGGEGVEVVDSNSDQPADNDSVGESDTNPLKSIVCDEKMALPDDDGEPDLNKKLSDASSTDKTAAETDVDTPSWSMLSLQSSQTPRPLIPSSRRVSDMSSTEDATAAVLSSADLMLPEGRGDCGWGFSRQEHATAPTDADAMEAACQGDEDWNGLLDPLPLNHHVTLVSSVQNPKNQYELDLILSLANG